MYMYMYIYAHIIISTCRILCIMHDVYELIILCVQHDDRGSAQTTQPPRRYSTGDERFRYVMYMYIQNNVYTVLVYTCT